MDARLLAWGRRVKARSQARNFPLWLFTDAIRMPDPIPSIRKLPRGMAGVVLRHDGMTGRQAVARQVASLCRARRLELSVAGDGRLAARLGAGLHLRGGRLPAGWLAARCRATGSAHSPADIGRCRRAGVAFIFISPVFTTPSHPGGRGLGPLRWAAWARLAGGRAAALGGIDGRTIRRLPKQCLVAGAITALRKA